METDSKDEGQKWYAMSVEEVFERLEASEEGLSSDEAESRLEKFGPNKLPEVRQRGPLMRFLYQFHNVLIYILLVAAAVTAALQEWVDSIVIFGVCVVNALIGFIQEGKAEKAMESLKQMLAPQAVSLRDGQKKSIAAEELIPGDVVFLKGGDRIPADLRLFQAKNLQIEESALTGESVPVEKNTYEVDPDTDLGDRLSMAFSGTMVTYGEAKGVVAATGAQTEIGRISTLLSTVETLTTPLIRKITKFGHFLAIAIVLLAMVTFAFGYFIRGYEPFEMFLAAVGLAVAAIPEGLPAIMTITLAIGVQRMAKRNAIIRKLPAVETLGAVTIICSDKTGTLTKNEMTLQSIRTADDLFEITGVGYDPEGEFKVEDQKISTEEHPVLMKTLRAGLLCNEAQVYPKDEGYKLEGAPTEGALVTAAQKAGLDQKKENEENPRLDSIPFSSEKKFMATLNRFSDGKTLILLKGAPEKVIERCREQLGNEQTSSLDQEFWYNAEEEVASMGQRVLAVAFKEAENEKDSLAEEDVQDGFIMLGLYGIIDPPREEAIEAAARLIGRCVSVKDCHSAGINVKMITGDHGLTAVSIANQLNIGDGKTFLSGHDLDKLSDEELQKKAPEVDVYARTSPEQKLRLVQALQAKNHIVAMTGDGVNDAPALKRADVGVAMGQSGTEAAKEASDMVLADDNFASIANAVEEGRTVYDNLKKTILFILPTNGGQALVVIVSILLGIGAMNGAGEFRLPITPPQILWINMVTAVTLALALAFEPPEERVMRRPPRPPDESLVTGFLFWRISLVSLLLVGGALGHYQHMLDQGASQELASTAAINTLVMGQVFYLFSSRFIFEPSWNLGGILGSRAVLVSIAILAVLQLSFTYLPFMQFIFETEPIDLEAWAKILVFGLLVFLVVEIEKTYFRRKKMGD